MDLNQLWTHYGAWKLLKQMSLTPAGVAKLILSNNTSFCIPYAYGKFLSSLV
jgi:hypothetical protein